jgi:hypothetical protein
MGCEKAGLMNTDPPNGIDYNSAELHEHGVTYAKIANDQRKNQDLSLFLQPLAVFAAILWIGSVWNVRSGFAGVLQSRVPSQSAEPSAAGNGTWATARQ